MADFSSSTFTYGNTHYEFNVAIGSQINQNINTTLESQYISEFSYTNSINQLCITGNLIYLDKFGKLTQFLAESFPTLVVHFSYNDMAKDGEVCVVDNTQDIKPLDYKFIINNIEILSRNNDHILYNLHLIGFNWYKCITNIKHSTYGIKNTNTGTNAPNNILELIKTGITTSGQKINTENFNTKIKCSVTLDYITNNNDNLFSYTKFIMNRLYSLCEERDESIKYLLYNEYTDTYSIGDTVYVSNESKKLPIIILSFMYSSCEEINYVKPNRISTVISLPKTKLIKSLQSRIIEQYDYNLNSFTSVEISSTQIIDYYNGSTTFGGMTPKQDMLPQELSANFTSHQATWNNDIHIYTEQINHLLGDNALIIDTDGQINTVPGEYITVAISKEAELYKNESDSANKEVNERFKELEGLWCIGSITNRISPANRYYRQTMSLFRNFKVTQAQ